MVNNGGPLSIAALYDVNGNSLAVDADDAIQRVEDFFQAHIERTGHTARRLS